MVTKSVTVFQKQTTYSRVVALSSVDDFPALNMKSSTLHESPELQFTFISGLCQRMDALVSISVRIGHGFESNSRQPEEGQHPSSLLHRSPWIIPGDRTCSLHAIFHATACSRVECEPFSRCWIGPPVHGVHMLSAAEEVTGSRCMLNPVFFPPISRIVAGTMPSSESDPCCILLVQPIHLPSFIGPSCFSSQSSTLAISRRTSSGVLILG